jgi:hypothetical protein
MEDCTAFEGPGHPYKKNIVKLNDMTARAAAAPQSETPVMDAIKAKVQKDASL